MKQTDAGCGDQKRRRIRSSFRRIAPEEGRVRKKKAKTGIMTKYFGEIRTRDLRGRNSACNLEESRTGRLRDLCIRTADWARMRACMQCRVAAACFRTR